MPSYLDFPTISEHSQIIFTHGAFDWPMIEVEYENKMRDDRPITDAGLNDDIDIVMKLRADDFALVGDFMRQIKVRITPFYINHPDLGRTLVQMQTKFEWTKIASGNPSYYAVTLRVREVFASV